MSYYQGDYYRGGFFSFLGGIAKKAVGFIPGVGPIAQKVLSAVPSSVGKGAMSAISAAKPATTAIAKVASKHPVLSAAAAAGALGTAAMVAHRGAKAAKVPGAGNGGGRRRINVCNPKALRRAIRRTHGFAKLAMRTIHLVHPKKKVRFGGYRKRRRKAA